MYSILAICNMLAHVMYTLHLLRVHFGNNNAETSAACKCNISGMLLIIFITTSLKTLNTMEYHVYTLPAPVHVCTACTACIACYSSK